MSSSYLSSRIILRHRAALLGACRFPGRSLVVLFLGGNALLPTGCLPASSTENAGLFVRNAPIPTPVPKDKQFVAAEALTECEDGSFVLAGAGCIMEPISTTRYLHEQHFRTLRAGMPVVYGHCPRFCVAHQLIEERVVGWPGTGFNRREPDGTLATSINPGVITAAFVSADTPSRADATSCDALLTKGKVGRQAAVESNFLQ